MTPSNLISQREIYTFCEPFYVLTLVHKNKAQLLCKNAQANSNKQDREPFYHIWISSGMQITWYNSSSVSLHDAVFPWQESL